MKQIKKNEFNLGDQVIVPGREALPPLTIMGIGINEHFQTIYLLILELPFVGAIVLEDVPQSMLARTKCQDTKAAPQRQQTTGEKLTNTLEFDRGMAHAFNVLDSFLDSVREPHAMEQTRVFVQSEFRRAMNRVTMHQERMPL